MLVMVITVQDYPSISNVLSNGSYTMAFELIWSSDDVDRDTVSLNGISAVETIHDLSSKTFNNYSRLIMQFSKSTDTAPNHLYVDICDQNEKWKIISTKTTGIHGVLWYQRNSIRCSINCL